MNIFKSVLRSHGLGKSGGVVFFFFFFFFFFLFFVFVYLLLFLAFLFVFLFCFVLFNSVVFQTLLNLLTRLDAFWHRLL